MCANYLPVTPSQLQGHFGVGAPDSDYPPESFPGYMSPIIRKPSADAGVGERAAALAMFGIVPHWAEPKLARQTYNARSETAASKPSYRHAFQQAQFCVIPAAVIFEPCYESGRAERFGIRAAHGEALGVAGIWEVKRHAENGLALLSFSMLTINADTHPLMRRFHRPNDEKRMLVFLRPDQYDAWLHCSAAQAPEFFTALPADQLIAAPAPREPTASARAAVPLRRPKARQKAAPAGASQTAFDMDL